MIYHIGYHKTASTWLQNEFFPFIDGINYLGIGNKRTDPPEWLMMLRRQLPHLMDHDAMRKCISDENRKGIALISDERMSGSMLCGQGAESYARLLKDVDPHAKVIICIREQSSMWESIYRQYIEDGGTLSFIDFMNEEDMTSDTVYLGNLNYYFLIKMYQDLFGSMNVLVLLYEDLLQNPTEFINSIYKFLGATAKNKSINFKRSNKSLDYYSLQVLRFLNPFLSTGQVPRPSYFVNSRYVRYVLRKVSLSSKKKFIQNYRSEIRAKYTKSNLMLNRLCTKLKLSHHGYI